MLTSHYYLFVLVNVDINGCYLSLHLPLDFVCCTVIDVLTILLKSLVLVGSFVIFISIKDLKNSKSCLLESKLTWNNKFILLKSLSERDSENWVGIRCFYSHFLYVSFSNIRKKSTSNNIFRTKQNFNRLPVFNLKKVSKIHYYL